MSEKCPTGCGRVVQFGHLTCKTCWYEIPRELRDKVNATWQKYSGFTGISLTAEANAERRQARLDYQAARDAALGSIK